MTFDVRRDEASSRRDFLRKGTAAAIALPTALSVIGACGESKAAPPQAGTTPAAPAAPSARQRADTMDAMHEKGIKAFPAKTEGKGNQLLAAADREGRQGLRAHRRGDPVGGRARAGRSRPGPTTIRFPGPQIRVREGDRVRVNLTTSCRNRPPSTSTGSSCPTTRTACRSSPSRRSSRASVHLRVHGAQRRLAHVPLAPQRRRSRSGMGLLGAFIVEPQASRGIAAGRRGLRDGPQRRRRTATP